MSEQAPNKAGNEVRSITVGLPELARDLARLRPGHPAGHHISNLIEQLKNYERNPILLKPMIQMSIRRIEEARS
jgi:hypothetical protein